MDQLSALLWSMIGVTAYLLVCGGFGAYVANQKGRSGLEGFAFGFVLGPMGVVAVGGLPNGRLFPTQNEHVEPDDEGEIGRLITEQFRPKPR